MATARRGGEIVARLGSDNANMTHLDLNQFVNPTPPDAQQTSPSQPAETTGRETLLFVEDENILRHTLCGALRSHAYTVLEAADPMEALEIVKEMTVAPDLLVTDFNMPHMNGRELHEKLLERFPGLKILLISGCSENFTLSSLHLRGPVPSLVKPFGCRELLGKIRQVLDAAPLQSAEMSHTSNSE